MKFLNIRKNGIDNVVDEMMYEIVYKPAGWKIVSENLIEIETTSTPADEIIKKNINKMKSTSAKKFNDNLIRNE